MNPSTVRHPETLGDNRRRRTRILVEAGPDLAARLAHQIRAAYQIQILEDPQDGLVMLRYRESARRTVFNLGEALVCRASVMIGEASGLGIVKDDDPDRGLAWALDLAVVDAAYNGRFPQTSQWDSLLLTAEQDLASHKIARLLMRNRTLVEFRSMDLASQGGMANGL